VRILMNSEQKAVGVLMAHDVADTLVPLLLLDLLPEAFPKSLVSCYSLKR
jgi:hypothetical protein